MTHPDPAAVAALLALAERASLPWEVEDGLSGFSRDYGAWNVNSNAEEEGAWLGSFGIAAADEARFAVASANLAPDLARSWLQMRAALEAVQARPANVGDLQGQIAAALAGRAGEGEGE